MLSSNGARAFIFTDLLPSFGCFLSFILYAALFDAARERMIKGSLRSLNPTPWAFLLGNCIGWVVYGTLTSDLYCYASSGPGIVLSCWLNLVASKLIYQEHVTSKLRAAMCTKIDAASQGKRTDKIAIISIKNNHGSLSSGISSDVNDSAILDQLYWDQMIDKVTFEKPPMAHDTLVICTVTFWVVLVAIITFIPMTREDRIFFVGLVVNINLVLFYVGPLSKAYVVVATSDSSSINRPTMIVNIVSSIIWTAYGVGRNDLFMSVPNGIGALLGFFQLTLCAFFPRLDAKKGNSCWVCRRNAPTNVPPIPETKLMSLPTGYDSINHIQRLELPGEPC